MANRVTVGICAYNESKNIGKLLRNLLSQQELSADSEVLVVCSGCTDNTVDIVQGYATKDSRIKSYVEAERQGKPSAINHILSHATGNAVLFISADTLPQKGSFPKLVSRLQEPEVGIVCGSPIPVNKTDSLVGRLVHILWGFHNHVFRELNDAGIARHATEVFCIRTGIVDRIPAETVNDDAYMAVTAKKKGWLIKFETQAGVAISGPKTFQEYFQQRRRIIFGHYQLRKLTGESPQYLVHLLPLHPVRTAKLVLWLFRKHDVLTLASFILTEFLVNATVIVDSASRKTHFLWSALPSTKTVFSQE